MSKGTKKHHGKDHHGKAAVSGDEPSPSGKMKRKEYEREMRILQGELVAMQEWVKATGARVCIVFEGVDSAGKGGTIRRITERTSPRVFKHIALPAPDARVQSQMYIQRYMAHFPSAGAGRDLRPQLVQPGRRRARHGLLHAGGDRPVPHHGARWSRRRWSMTASS